MIIARNKICMRKNMKTQSSLDKKIINQYLIYQENRDFRLFMENISDFIFQFTRKRLNRDPDIVSDFFVHFYERAQACLDRYKNYQHLPFSGFLVTNIRHEFYNFIRKKRRSQIEMSPSEAILGMKSKLELNEQVIHNSNDDDRHRLSRELVKLPMNQRLPVKLYFGLELGIEELQELLTFHPQSRNASVFLQDYRSRRAKRLEQLGRLQDRVRKLNHQIHSYSIESDESQNKGLMYKKWKDKIVEALQKERGIYSFQELGNLFLVNKTTIARRIEKAKNILKGQLIYQNKEASA